MSAKVEIDSKTLASKAVILDIEGTTTSITFVKVSQCVIFSFSNKLRVFPTKTPLKTQLNMLCMEFIQFSREKSFNSHTKLKWPVTLPRKFFSKSFVPIHIRADSKWKLFYPQNCVYLYVYLFRTGISQQNFFFCEMKKFRYVWKCKKLWMKWPCIKLLIFAYTHRQSIHIIQTHTHII